MCGIHSLFLNNVHWVYPVGDNQVFFDYNFMLISSYWRTSQNKHVYIYCRECFRKEGFQINLIKLIIKYCFVIFTRCVCKLFISIITQIEISVALAFELSAHVFIFSIGLRNREKTINKCHWHSEYESLVSVHTFMHV
jgi:hypothetical protein